MNFFLGPFNVEITSGNTRERGRFGVKGISCTMFIHLLNWYSCIHEESFMGVNCIHCVHFAVPFA